MALGLIGHDGMVGISDAGCVKFRVWYLRELPCFGRLWGAAGLGWAGLAGCCGRWLGRGLGRGADGGFADEDGTGFDGEGLGLDVADDFGAGLEFDAVGGGEVAVDLAVDDDGGGFDFGLDAGVFTDGQVAIGGDFALDFAIDDEVVGEFDGAFDFDVGGEDVAGGSGA